LSDFSEVHVHLSQGEDRSYRVLIRPGLIQQIRLGLGDLLDGQQGHGHWVVITDDTVAPLYLDLLIDQIGPCLRRVDTMVVPAGEGTKSVADCQKIWQKLVESRTDRKSTILALGGGVIGDLAGFAAASFARGLDFVQVPTTLLAQVDSSVGGKVGINLPQAKNIIGAFWQPRRVIIDPDVLKTLSLRDYRCGLAEVVKYGVILDADFFQFLENSILSIQQQDSDVLSQIITRCCQLKAQVVEADQFETSGRRAILNYGHTFGHAIESVYGYGTWLHGEAVSMGMTCAARLAVRMKFLSPHLFQRQTQLLRQLGLPTDLPDHAHQQLIEAMQHDKKVVQGSLNLILPTALGHVSSVPAPDHSMLLASLQNDYSL